MSSPLPIPPFIPHPFPSFSLLSFLLSSTVPSFPSLHFLSSSFPLLPCILLFFPQPPQVWLGTIQQPIGCHMIFRGSNLGLLNALGVLAFLWCLFQDTFISCVMGIRFMYVSLWQALWPLTVSLLLCTQTSVFLVKPAEEWHSIAYCKWLLCKIWGVRAEAHTQWYCSDSGFTPGRAREL